MNPVSVLLLAAGGAIQLTGVAYAVIGFDALNIPLLIGAFVVGGLVEFAGIALHAMGRG